MNPYTIIRPMKILSPFRAKILAPAVLALTLAADPTLAHAQLRLPAINLPLPGAGLPLGSPLLRDAGSSLGRVRDLADVRNVRLELIETLLRRHRSMLEADPRGEPVVRSEILAWSPSPEALAGAQAAGLKVLRESRLDGLGEVMVVLAVPAGLETARVLEQLRARDPQGTYDFNHLYTGSGADADADAVGEAEDEAEPGAAADGGAGPAPSKPSTPGQVRVGLVDSGVDTTHEVFRDASIRHWGCGESRHPDPHGTAVAALMIGQSPPFTGVAPQASLFAADIYCASPSGGSAERIAAALGWMARENIAVVNLSIVGPANATLERVVASMVRRGHLLVAAVGNDGPAAPPLYPASYPGVVGVSAVDKRGRVLPEAGRGPQVMFAAPGNQMVSAAPGAPPFRQVRGTSYAAPIVAAMLADALPRPDQALAAEALSALAKRAVRADRAVVSNDTGHGVVGQPYRIDPASLR